MDEYLIIVTDFVLKANKNEKKLEDLELKQNKVWFIALPVYPDVTRLSWCYPFIPFLRTKSQNRQKKIRSKENGHMINIIYTIFDRGQLKGVLQTFLNLPCWKLFQSLL